MRQKGRLRRGPLGLFAWVSARLRRDHGRRCRTRSSGMCFSGRPGQFERRNPQAPKAGRIIRSRRSERPGTLATLIRLEAGDPNYRPSTRSTPVSPKAVANLRSSSQDLLTQRIGAATIAGGRLKVRNSCSCPYPKVSGAGRTGGFTLPGSAPAPMPCSPERLCFKTGGLGCLKLLSLYRSDWMYEHVPAQHRAEKQSPAWRASEGDHITRQVAPPRGQRGRGRQPFESSGRFRLWSLYAPMLCRLKAAGAGALEMPLLLVGGKRTAPGQ